MIQARRPSNDVEEFDEEEAFGENFDLPAQIMPKIIEVEKQKTKGSVVVSSVKTKVIESDVSPPRRDTIERLLTSPPRVNINDDFETDLFLQLER